MVVLPARARPSGELGRIDAAGMELGAGILVTMLASEDAVAAPSGALQPR